MATQASSGINAAWRIGMSPNISIDWTASGDKLTFPIGLGVSRMVNIGPLPVNLDGEIEYSVIASQRQAGKPLERPLLLRRGHSHFRLLACRPRAGRRTAEGLSMV